MDAVLTALYEILTAATATSQELDGAVVTDEENEVPAVSDGAGGIKHPIVLSPIETEFLEQSVYNYEIAREYVFLTVMVRVDKQAANRYQAASRTARAWAKKVRKVIYAAPSLASTTYPSGLVRDDNDTRITRQAYGYRAEQDVWYALARLRLETVVIYRNGVPKLQ